MSATTTRVAARLATIAREAVAQVLVKLEEIKAPPELRAVAVEEVSRAALEAAERVREDGRA